MHVPLRQSRAIALVWLLFCIVTAPALGRDEILEPSVATPPSDVTIPNPLSLEWCLERARRTNPSLAEARAASTAAGHRIRPAGALDDPRFAYEASNLPVGDFDFESTPLSGHQLGLRQKLPLPGLLARRADAARQGAEASALLFDDRMLVVAGAVESAWAEFGFAWHALDITQQNIALLRQLSATAESRYRVGGALQQDVLRAQVELTALIQERLRRVEALARAQANLVALLDLPVESRLPRTETLLLSAAEPDVSALLSELPVKNARLRSAEKRVEEARLRVRVTELESLPDVDLGIGYRVRQNVRGDPVQGDDFLSAGVTVRLPVNRSKWRAKIAERNALVRQAEASMRALHAELGAKVRSAHAQLIRATSEEALLETGLVPQARQSLEATRSAYGVGRTEFLSLLDSQVRLLDAELRLARARADKRIAYAGLEVASGEKLR